MHVSAKGFSAEGAAWRVEVCDDCGKEFYYLNEQVGYGEALSMMGIGAAGNNEAAAREAQGDLRFRLKHLRQLVKCANCGRFQQAAVVQRRQELASQAIRTGFFWTLFPVFGFGIASVVLDKNASWSNAAIFAMFGSGLFGGFLTVAAWVIARSFFDPNIGRYLLWRADQVTEAKGMTQNQYEQLIQSNSEE